MRDAEPRQPSPRPWPTSPPPGFGISEHAPARTAREVLAALTGAGSQAGDHVVLELPRDLSASQRRERIDRWCAVLAELWADGREVVASLGTVAGEKVLHLALGATDVELR